MQEYYRFHLSSCPNSYTVWDLQELLHEARGRKERKKEGLLMQLDRDKEIRKKFETK